jgi:hypothetical protein
VNATLGARPSGLTLFTKHEVRAPPQLEVPPFLLTSMLHVRPVPLGTQDSRTLTINPFFLAIENLILRASASLLAIIVLKKGQHVGIPFGNRFCPSTITDDLLPTSYKVESKFAIPRRAESISIDYPWYLRLLMSNIPPEEYGGSTQYFACCAESPSKPVTKRDALQTFISK